MDVLCEEDPSILVEALQAIADEQPIVARSIPKHAKIIEKDHNTQLKNCIFEPEVSYFEKSILLEGIQWCAKYLVLKSRNYCLILLVVLCSKSAKIFCTSPI